VQDEVDLDKYLARRAREKAKGKAGNGFGLTLDMAVRLIGPEARGAITAKPSPAGSA
jgi:hypothetical protein|tara:strand:+ start:244 stop:414 length:171 start_codon:yes stop_codon:yes gene_type:complete